MKTWTDFTQDGAQYSPTEELGLSLITQDYKNILSIGVSTAGFAEVRMALDEPQRTIVATTLDEEGLKFSEKLIEKYSVENQVRLKIEDIASELEYGDAQFDFVYARLVLHYLPKEALRKALKNIHRVLKMDGEFFIVVRSYDWASEVPGSVYDIETGMTTYPSFDSQNQVIKESVRYLHSVGSITSFVKEAGFNIKFIELFSETIFSGYQRVAENRGKLPAKLIALHVGK